MKQCQVIETEDRGLFI